MSSIINVVEKILTAFNLTGITYVIQTFNFSYPFLFIGAVFLVIGFVISVIRRLIRS